MPASRETLIYRALRSASGKGGYAENENGIDGLIRRVRAAAIASVAEQSDNAVLQGFPNHATDLLGYYERLVGLSDDPDLTIEERQQAAATIYALQQASDVPSLRQALALIDERFTIVTSPYATSTTTITGRAFEDLAGDEPFGGGRESSAYPNFSSTSELRVVFELGDGVQPTAEERRKIKLARRLLHDAIPATTDLQIVTHRGFILDVSRLDLTSFGG